MENKEEINKERIKEMKTELNLMRQKRTERNRPTVWYNRKIGLIEIHYEKRTVIARVESIDTETPREDSDRMAQGSNFKQVIYQTEEEI